MREIKFRAWDKKSRKMFNVDVLAISPCTWDCPDYGRKGVSLAYQPHIKVMQFTGLHDKSGTEIYEGDIVYTTYPHCHAIVTWDTTRFIGYTIEYESKIIYVDRIDKNNKSALEVIGNIHENPELLEVEQ